MVVKGEIAVLMAAGMGTRMHPLTERVPKPLVKARGVALIETVIGGLLRRGVARIYVVTGYMADSFRWLAAKYPQVELVYNPDYERMNNISSVRAVANELGGADCFICEADLYVADPSIFDAELKGSCYFAKRVAGWSDDWVFDVDADGIITRVGTGGQNALNMVGIAYFRADDAARIARAIVATCADNGNSQLFWDEVVDRHLEELELTVHEVEGWQLHEIDTLEQLATIDPDWAGSNRFERI